jgi:hypothetical protein
MGQRRSGPSPKSSVKAEAVRQGKPATSKCSTGLTEVLPAHSAANVSGQLPPSGVNAPTLRTKIRRLRVSHGPGLTPSPR